MTKAQKASVALKQKAAAVSKRLLRLYGRPTLEKGEDPVDTLVRTILSQNTTDVNSHKSFVALKKAYSEWEPLIDEDTKKVVEIIRSGGLAELKARRIQDALGHIRRERGEINMDFLGGMSVEEADLWLSRIKGVGPKTRAIVMLFSLGLPAFPVDTHVHRVAKRLGLISEKTSRGKAQEYLSTLVPETEFYAFHINLIKHGRRTCKAQRPLCKGCALRTRCDYRSASQRA